VASTQREEKTPEKHATIAAQLQMEVAAKQAIIDAQTAQLAGKDQEIQRLTKWAQRAAQDKREKEQELLRRENLRKEGLRKEEESTAAKQATIDAHTAQLAAKDQEIQRLTKWAQRAAQDTREEKEKRMKEGLRKEEKINAMVGVTRELQEQLCCLKLQLDQRQADLERADLEQWLLLREFCGKSQPGQIGASEACDSGKHDAPPRHIPGHAISHGCR